MAEPVVTIEPAWRESYVKPGHDVRCGWHLIVDGEWCQTYPTKREAREAVSRTLAARPEEPA